MYMSMSHCFGGGVVGLVTPAWGLGSILLLLLLLLLRLLLCCWWLGADIKTRKRDDDTKKLGFGATASPLGVSSSSAEAVAVRACLDRKALVKGKAGRHGRTEGMAVAAGSEGCSRQFVPRRLPFQVLGSADP